LFRKTLIESAQWKERLVYKSIAVL
jgi:hypothetical protein